MICSLQGENMPINIVRHYGGVYKQIHDSSLRKLQDRGMKNRSFRMVYEARHSYCVQPYKYYTHSAHVAVFSRVGDTAH